MKCLEVSKIDLIKNKEKILRIIYITISIVLSSILYNLLLLPLCLVTNGVPGIATITNYLYGIDPAIMISLLSIACCIISFIYLGIEKTTGSLLGTIAYPRAVKLTSNLNGIIDPNTVDVLLLVIFAGVLSGIANGLMYKSGYSNGGFPIISQVLFEKFKISVGKSSLIINVTIVSIGALFFGITDALYAIIFLYINSIVLDKVLLGISDNKAFYIITRKEKEIEKYIIDNLNHATTVFDVKGGYQDNNKKVILTVIPSREYYRVTENIKEIDKDAFFLVTDSYQVEGAK